MAAGWVEAMRAPQRPQDLVGGHEAVAHADGVGLTVRARILWLEWPAFYLSGESLIVAGDPGEHAIVEHGDPAPPELQQIPCAPQGERRRAREHRTNGRQIPKRRPSRELDDRGDLGTRTRQLERHL